MPDSGSADVPSANRPKLMTGPKQQDEIESEPETDELFAILANADGTSALPEIGPRGWSYRGYLPHFDDEETTQFITFRLADAMPNHVVESWRRELQLTAEVGPSPRHVKAQRTLRTLIEKYLDSGYGSCVLRQTEVAQIVQNALQCFDGQRYQLYAWVVMPNHVHVLCRQTSGWQLSTIVQSWKSFTAHAINKHLGRTGTLWQADYFDRWIRNDNHFLSVAYYIEHNPVTAGLCKSPSDWLSCSARSAAVPSAAVCDSGSAAIPSAVEPQARTVAAPHGKKDDNPE